MLTRSVETLAGGLWLCVGAGVFGWGFGTFAGLPRSLRGLAMTGRIWARAGNDGVSGLAPFRRSTRSTEVVGVVVRGLLALVDAGLEGSVLGDCSGPGAEVEDLQDRGRGWWPASRGACRWGPVAVRTRFPGR